MNAIENAIEQEKEIDTADIGSGEENRTLKKGSISMIAAIIMSVSAAAPAMCIAGSMGLFMEGAGRAVPLAFLVSTVVIALVAVSFAQLSERYSGAGGTYSYVRSAIGGKSGWFTGWIYIGIIVGAGAIGSIFAIYLNSIFPQIPLWLCVALIVIPTYLVGWFGAQLSAKLTLILWVAQTALLVIPVFHCIGIALPDIGSVATQAARGWIPEFGFNGLLAAVLLTVWSYIGFEVPAYLGEEVKGGGKAIKRILPAGGIIIGLVYVVVTWLWILPISPEALAVMLGSETALMDLVNFLNYPEAQWFILIAVLMACLACWFSFVTAMIRMLYDMGRSKAMPAAFGKLNKHASPHVALLVVMIIWAVMSLVGAYFSLNLLLAMLATFACVAYLFVCLANLKDRWREKGIKAFFTNKVVPIVAIFIMCWMISSQTLTYLIITGIFALAGIIIILILRKVKGKEYFDNMKI